MTEKFFKILDLDMVPVVYGGADYSQHSPPHSYIDPRKFKPKQLAAYLKVLDTDDALCNVIFLVEGSLSSGIHLREHIASRILRSPFQSFADKEVISDLGDENKCQPFDPNWIL